MKSYQMMFREKPIPYFGHEDGTIFSRKTGKPLSTSISGGRHGKPSSLKVTITFPEGQYAPYKYHKNTPNSKNERLPVSVHRIIKETIEPLDTHYHELGITDDEWERTPERVKTILKEGGPVIDHKDDNPFNNHIANLVWKTSLDNSSHRKKQLG